MSETKSNPALAAAENEVATAWVRRHPAVTGAIAGLRRPGHVDAIVGAAGLRLLDDEVVAIESVASCVA